MCRLYILLFSALLLSACANRPRQLQIEVLNSYTPVKDQGDSQTCWAYAMLAAIETEHIMRGDSIHLSVAYVERTMRRDRQMPPKGRAIGMTLINMIQRYGIVPYGAMPDNDPDLPLPRYAFMDGCRYTPQEFAHSVCAPGEWIGLCCNEDSAYYKECLFDVPDNWEHNRLLNIPADSLLLLTERAVRQGHGVCWEGDISERGFLSKEGLAVTSLFNGSTTDDHCMAIVGLARDETGQLYFILKNSWGETPPYGGLIYMSSDYFRKKTLAIYLVLKHQQGWHLAKF